MRDYVNYYQLNQQDQNMGLSDCIKCWDTPCTCGYGYRNMSLEDRLKQAAVGLGVDALELRDRLVGFTDQENILPVDHPRKGEK